MKRRLGVAAVLAGIALAMLVARAPAIEALAEAGSQDPAAAPQPWPADGVLYQREAPGEGNAKLTVRSKAPEGVASLVRFYDGDEALALCLIVSGGESVAVTLPGGIYWSFADTFADWADYADCFVDGVWREEGPMPTAPWGVPGSMEFKGGAEYEVTLNLVKEDRRTITAPDF